MDRTYGLEAVQKANLRILKAVEDICQRHGISYMLDAGTLLGAVRHRGFIPWDDDADLAMRRDEWDRFRRIAEEELPKEMHLQLPEELAEQNRFYDFTPRIILKTSRRHTPDEESAFYEEKLNHLWVDIFLLDVLPDGKLGAFAEKSKQKLIYALAMGHRRKLDYEKYSLPQKLGLGVLSKVGRLFSMRSLCAAQRKWAVSCAKKQTGHVYYSNYQPDYLYVTLERSWVEKMMPAPFEDTELSIPEHYDEILNIVYGDYMQLPPPEQRVPSHGTEKIEIYEETESGNIRI